MLLLQIKEFALTHIWLSVVIYTVLIKPLQKMISLFSFRQGFILYSQATENLHPLMSMRVTFLTTI